MTESGVPLRWQANDDPLFVRDINFDNVWVAGKLSGDAPAAVRLAPRSPRSREPLICSTCRTTFFSPSVRPAHWPQHSGAAVQAAAGLQFRCYECCRRRLEPMPHPLFE